MASVGVSRLLRGSRVLRALVPSMETLRARVTSVKPFSGGVRSKEHLTRSIGTGRPAISSQSHLAENSNICEGGVTCTDNQSTGCLEVTWENSESTSFPFVYLRENCPCPACFHPTGLARAFLFGDLDLNVKPLQMTFDQSEVAVVWSDGHSSVYPLPWLRDRIFSKAHKYSELQANRANYRLWGKDIAERYHHVDYLALLNSEDTMMDFMLAVIRDGLAIIQNAPTEQGVLPKLLSATGIPRPTHYGPKTFHVVTKVGANNLAYTPAQLELHVDIPLYLYTPGIQFLHCIKQHLGEGGGNQFVDGFMVATQIKEEDPEAYHALITTPVVFEDRGVDHIEFHKVNETRTLTFDADGNLFRINFNNFSRSSFLPAAEEQVVPFYRALKKFYEYCYQERNLFTYKMNDGDIFVLNNLRILHGREAYVPTDTGERYLEGGYVDWDEFLSLYRVFSNRRAVTNLDNNV